MPLGILVPHWYVSRLGHLGELDKKMDRYLAIAENTSDRVEFRRSIDRAKGAGYRGRSGEHKIFVHLQTLYRLGLIMRPSPTKSRIYQVPEQARSTRSGLAALIERLPNCTSLELLVKNRKWPEVAAEVFEITATTCSDTSEFSSDVPELRHRGVNQRVARSVRRGGIRAFLGWRAISQGPR